MRGYKITTLAILATLIIASMAATVAAPLPPDDYLYVDGFDASYVEWTPVGSSPYLDAPDDGSYIEGTTDAAFMAWFTFTDIDPGYFTDYAIEAVWLQAYTTGPYSGNVDYDAYNGGMGWLGSFYGNGAPQWVNLRWISPPDAPTSDSDPSLLEQDGINAFKVLLYFFDPVPEGGPGNIVDAMRLKVTFKDKPAPTNPQMWASSVFDTGLVPSSMVPIEITALNVYDLYGFEFRLGYDPAVITAQSIVLGEFFPEGSVEWINSIDNVGGVAWYSVTMPFGAPKGVNGDGVIAVITFHVEDVGRSDLAFVSTMMGNRYGFPIEHDANDGAFANSDNFAVSIKTAHPEHNRFIVSKDEDGYQTLTASIKNYGDMTEAKVEFAINDELGAPVATLETAAVTMSHLQLLWVEADWNGYSVPQGYSVDARVLYKDMTGAWVAGQKGSPSGSREIMTIGFTVEA